MKNYPKLFINLIAILLFVSACQQADKSASEEVADNFTEAKEEMNSEFAKLSDEIDDKIDNAKDKMNVDEGPIERNIEETVKELENAKSEIERSLGKIDDSSKDSWGKTEKELEKVKSDIEQKLSKIEKDLKS